MSCALSLSEFVEKVCEKRKKGKRTKNKKKKTNPGANPGVLNAKGGILDTAASNSSLIHMLAFHLVRRQWLKRGLEIGCQLYLLRLFSADPSPLFQIWP